MPLTRRTHALRLVMAFLYLVVIPLALALVAFHNWNTNDRQDRAQATEIRDNKTQIRRNHALIVELETVRDGVCTLWRERRASVSALEDVLARTRKFLLRFPGGLPSIHVSRADIEQSIRSQEANIVLQKQTVKALAVVRCGA